MSEIPSLHDTLRVEYEAKEFDKPFEQAMALAIFEILKEDDGSDTTIDDVLRILKEKKDDNSGQSNVLLMLYRGLLGLKQNML